MTANTDGDDPRLAELLLRWEELHEQGQSLSADELCSTCPELAGELARRIALLRQFDPVLADTNTAPRDPVPVMQASGSSRQTATARADYSDLRFHAAGALGEVFMARNAELNREVALKFLKPERSRDPESLRRFIQEAEVTGRLEHPGVVPIYTLGTDAAGAPCYAMRFIRGATLQDPIDAFHAADQPGRDPSERSLALRELLNRFVSICTTVAYAHNRGILHRDLKPRNVMLGKYDETLVVDWGLAKPFDRDESVRSAGEEALTPSSGSSGSGPVTPTVGVVGTPAYMSPEQAEARSSDVGLASDIFSLGAILYAILTGQVPYRGRTHGEILDKVKRCEFPRPRQIKPETPRALEAICLKAMAARPQDRYATALDLAADAKRWLADEPVRAWPEPFSLRARRWMRRHRTLVTTAAAVLVLSVVGLAGFVTVLAGKNRELDRQRQRAEEREGLAIDAVKKFRDAVSANLELKNRPELDSLRKGLLKEPMEFFRTLRDQLQADRDTRPDALAKLAAANFDLADTTRQIGSVPDAIRSYSESIAIRERLARDHPTVTKYQRDLAASHNDLGKLQLATGHPTEALESHRRAVAILERLAGDNPAVVRFQSELATCHNNIGQLLTDMGHPAEAMKPLRRALEIRERLARDHPATPEFQSALAGSHDSIGFLLGETGHPAEALESHRRALAIHEQLARDHPTVTEYQQYRAQDHNLIGNRLSETGHLAEALEPYRNALAIRVQLTRDNPSITSYQRDLATSHNNHGALLAKMDRLTEALESFRQALEIGERLARDHPSVHDYQSSLGATLLNIALIETSQGRWREAREHLERAIKHQQSALAALPGNPFYQMVLKLDLLYLSKAHQALNQPAEAIRVTRELAELSRGNAADLYNVACALALSVPLTRGEPEQALAAEAVQTLKEAIAAGWNDAGKTSRDPDLVPLRDRDDFRRLLATLFDRGFPADPFAR